MSIKNLSKVYFNETAADYLKHAYILKKINTISQAARTHHCWTA